MIIPETLGGGVTSPGTYPHPATLWGWKLFLGQLTELYHQ